MDDEERIARLEDALHDAETTFRNIVDAILAGEGGRSLLLDYAQGGAAQAAAALEGCS